MKPGKIIIGSHRPNRNILKLAIGLGSLKFSRMIARKYGIFLRYDSLPALVFRKLSDIKNTSNSLKNGPFKNYINLQKFSSFIYPSKRNSKLFKNCIVSACDIRACVKTQKFERFYNPAYRSPETNIYRHATFTAEKNVIKSSSSSRFITKTGTEEIIPEHIGEGKGQFIQLFYNPFSYKRETPTSVHKLIFSHLLKGFNFDTSMSINTALKDTEKSSFKKTGTVAQYGNSLLSQIRDRKKQLITNFIQYPLFARNIQAVVNSAKYSHLQRELKREINTDASTSINAAIQDMGMLYFKKWETCWKHENNLTKLIRESKKIILKILNQYTLYSHNTQVLVKPLTLDYLDKTSNFEFLSLKRGQTVVSKKKTDKASKKVGLATQKIDTASLSKEGSDSYYENNLTRQIGERKKHFISNLNRYPLYVRCSLVVVNSANLSHLQRKLNSVSPINMKTAIQDKSILSFKKMQKDSKYEKSKDIFVNQVLPGHLHKIFNFLLSSLQHDQIVVSTKKMDETSKNKSLTTHEIDTPYFSKKDTDSHYENNLNKQIERNNKKSIKTLNEYPLYARNILAVVNSVMFSHLQRELNFVTPSRIKAAIQDTGTLSSKKTEKDSKYKKNVNISVNPVAFSYLQKIFDFEFSSLKRGQIVVSNKKMDETSKNTSLTIQKIDTTFLSKKDNDSYYENSLTRQIGERKRQLITKSNQYQLFIRNVLEVANSVAPGNLQKASNFESSSLKYRKIDVSEKKLYETSENTVLVTQEIDTPYLIKKNYDSHYENYLTKQFWEIKKQFITTLNQYPLHARNILAVVNSTTLSHLQREINFVNSTSIKAVIQEMCTLSFKKKKISLKNENNLIKQIGERKKQFITKSNQYTLLAQNNLAVANLLTLSYLQKTFNLEFSSLEHGQAVVNIKKLINASMSINAAIQGVDIPSIPSINSVIPGYVHNKNIDMPSLETNRIVSAAKKIEIFSVRKFVNSQSTHTNSQGIDILSLQQVWISNNNGDNSSEQIKEGKNQLVTYLSNPYLSTKALLTSVNNVTLNYLQRAFNFKTVNSKLEPLLFIEKNTNKVSTIVFAAHRGIDLSSFQQTRNIQDLQYGSSFNHGTNLTGNAVSAFQNRSVPKGSINLFQDNILSNSLIDLKHIFQLIKKNRSSEVNEDTIYESRELVLKKLSPQKAEIFSENKGETLTENISSSRIDAGLGKELTKEKPIHEINRIADRVYKIIERRISIEKDRRGLF